jgi:CheY-like chemotaxis protein
MTSIAGLSLLLVEDEYLIALDAEQMLLDLGAAKVEVVGTYEEAQARTLEGQFDLAVLDVNINGKLSYPIAENLRRRGTPFVFATGYGVLDRPRADFEGSAFVSKPYTKERLRQALCSVLPPTAN